VKHSDEVHEIRNYRPIVVMGLVAVFLVIVFYYMWLIELEFYKVIYCVLLIGVGIFVLFKFTTHFGTSFYYKIIFDRYAMRIVGNPGGYIRYGDIQAIKRMKNKIYVICNAEEKKERFIWDHSNDRDSMWHNVDSQTIVTDNFTYNRVVEIYYTHKTYMVLQQVAGLNEVEEYENRMEELQQVTENKIVPESVSFLMQQLGFVFSSFFIGGFAFVTIYFLSMFIAWNEPPLSFTLIASAVVVMATLIILEINRKESPRPLRYEIYEDCICCVDIQSSVIQNIINYKHVVGLTLTYTYAEAREDKYSVSVSYIQPKSKTVESISIAGYLKSAEVERLRGLIRISKNIAYNDVGR